MIAHASRGWDYLYFESQPGASSRAGLWSGSSEASRVAVKPSNLRFSFGSVDLFRKADYRAALLKRRVGTTASAYLNCLNSVGYTAVRRNFCERFRGIGLRRADSKWIAVMCSTVGQYDTNL